MEPGEAPAPCPLGLVDHLEVTLETSRERARFRKRGPSGVTRANVQEPPPPQSPGTVLPAALPTNRLRARLLPRALVHARMKQGERSRRPESFPEQDGRTAPGWA